MECDGRRQGKGFICWQGKLRDTSSTGIWRRMGVAGASDSFVETWKAYRRGGAKKEKIKEDNCRKMADPKFRGFTREEGQESGWEIPSISSDLGMRSE